MQIAYYRLTALAGKRPDHPAKSAGNAEQTMMFGPRSKKQSAVFERELPPNSAYRRRNAPQDAARFQVGSFLK